MTRLGRGALLVVACGAIAVFSLVGTPEPEPPAPMVTIPPLAAPETTEPPPPPGNQRIVSWHRPPGIEPDFTIRSGISNPQEILVPRGLAAPLAQTMLILSNVGEDGGPYPFDPSDPMGRVWSRSPASGTYVPAGAVGEQPEE